MARLKRSQHSVRKLAGPGARQEDANPRVVDRPGEGAEDLREESGTV